MATLTTSLPPAMTTADGIPLKTSLQHAQRRARRRAFLLVVPLLLFIVVTFMLPIGDMLLRSVQNPQMVEAMPALSQALRDWDGQTLPDEALFAVLVADFKRADANRDAGKVGNRLNYEQPGMSSLIRKSVNRGGKLTGPPYKEAMIAIDKRWGELGTWRLLQRTAHPYTDTYLLAAVDLTRDANNEIVSVPEEMRLHLFLFERTFLLSLTIMGLTLLLGYPVAHMLATLPTRQSNLLMILVLLPFWTSLLVRTTAWIVMLQSQGVLNSLLVWVGLVDDQNRLSLIFNQTGTIIAMTHILLPFMILPLYSVMKTIPPNYVRAARSLGANPWTAFWKIYVPQTLPGVGAGGVLVFILAIGYFITPALVGGSSGQLISNRIAFHMQESLNWGLAAALGAILLAAVLILYALYNRLLGGLDNMKLG